MAQTLFDAPARRPDRIGSAIGLRVASAACAACIGLSVHGATAAGATTGQAVLMRAALSLPFLLLWAAATAPPRRWMPRRPGRHLLRGIMGGTVMCLNFYALGQLPVAHAQTLSYLSPILSVPAAVVLLGERLSVRAVLAVALGFAGMIAMLYTAVDNPDWGWREATGMAAGIAGALIMALLRVLIRSMTATETTISIALSFAVVTTAIGALVTLFTGFAPMTPVLWAWLGGAGLFGALTHVMATEAAARAPVSVLAPFDYAGLIFAVTLDIAIFAHLPGPWGWLGIALIVAAGVMTAVKRPWPEGTFLRLK